MKAPSRLSRRYVPFHKLDVGLVSAPPPSLPTLSYLNESTINTLSERTIVTETEFKSVEKIAVSEQAISDMSTETSVYIDRVSEAKSDNSTSLNTKVGPRLENDLSPEVSLQYFINNTPSASGVIHEVSIVEPKSEPVHTLSSSQKNRPTTYEDMRITLKRAEHRIVNAKNNIDAPVSMPSSQSGSTEWVADASHTDSVNTTNHSVAYTPRTNDVRGTDLHEVAKNVASILSPETQNNDNKSTKAPSTQTAATQPITRTTQPQVVSYQTEPSDRREPDNTQLSSSDQEVEKVLLRKQIEDEFSLKQSQEIKRLMAEQEQKNTRRINDLFENFLKT